MRKKSLFFFVIISLFITIFFSRPVFAANGYDFEVNYTGDVKKGETKDVDVILVGDGTNAAGYSNVQIKVETTGPAMPELLATDSAGTEYNIAQIGHWGPDAGFSVPATVRNLTPVKAKFSVAGDYTITLSLIDKANSDAVITTKTVTVTVLDTSTGGASNNTGTNEVILEGQDGVTNDAVEGEIPKAGLSITEMVIYFVGIISVFIFVIYRVRNLNS